jgi:gliding motility-associated-like protein
MIRNAPDARIMGYDGKEICESDSILLQPGTVVPTSTYKWTPARFFDDYSEIPVTYARVDFNDKIKLEVTDEFGCKAADSLAFKTKPCCEVVFPTAFTPNGDGKNDYFHPVYIGSGTKSHMNEGGKELKTFRIVNRWGQAVFESANSNKGWDGMMNGKPQDMGNYYYYINYTCNGRPAEQKGELMLVR